MTNLLQQAINCDDRDRAAKIIQDALWPANRERRARIIGTWLQTEARYSFGKQ